MCTFAFEITLDNALAGLPTRLDWNEEEWYVSDLAYSPEKETIK
jgi:hypothetical protein